MKDDLIYTPPLSDAPVAGILRERLLTRLPDTKMIEKTITIQDAYSADEIFLTNSVRGIRWVEYIDEKRLTNSTTKKLFKEFTEVVYEHFGEHLV